MGSYEYFVEGKGKTKKDKTFGHGVINKAQRKKGKLDIHYSKTRYS